MAKLGFQLAKEYSHDMKVPKLLKDEPPPIGWYVSEKLDGYRTRRHPELGFVSRQNKHFNAIDKEIPTAATIIEIINLL